MYIIHFRNHKVVGISTVSKVEHSTAQTRELECTKIVLPQVLERGQGSNVASHLLSWPIYRIESYRGGPRLSIKCKALCQGRAPFRKLL